MPRGEHPNSKKALAKNRKKTQFCSETAVKAQEKSAIKQRQNGQLKEIFQKWLDTEFQDEKGQVITGAGIVLKACAEQVTLGNVRAMAFMRDTAGQKPAEAVNVSLDKPDSEDVQMMLKELQKRGKK